MVAGTRTFSLEDTFLDPQALEPPPTRHALFILLLALAAMLHLGTTGWGDLYDGPEGQFAGGAKEMLATQQWLVPTNNGVPCLETSPLVYWLIALSYKILGVSPMAARFPGAIALIASIALTFLIGERLAGYWRGFSAGLIHLCLAGTFFIGRGATAEPVFSFFIAGAVYCLVCGYHRSPFRRAWFTGFWLCASFACLTKGPLAFLYLAGICLLSAIFFREARLRFRSLLHWSYLLLFLIIVLPWYIWTQKHFPEFFPRTFIWPSYQGLPRWQFLVLQLACSFPVTILVLPGLLFAPRKIIRPHEIAFADALPIFWMAIGFLPLLLPSHPSAYSSMSMWSAFALWSALVWDRTPRRLRMVELAFLVLAGVVLSGIAFLPAVWGSPATEWLTLRHLSGIAGVAIGMFAIPALYSATRQRSEMALLLALVAMVPAGLCLTEGASRAAPSFSLAGAARFLNLHLADGGQVLFEGPLYRASSLTFYLNQKFLLVNPSPDLFDGSAATLKGYVTEDYVLKGWTSSDPLYLIIDQSRVSYWQDRIVDRTHIFHQVTSCGDYVVPDQSDVTQQDKGAISALALDNCSSQPKHS